MNGIVRTIYETELVGGTILRPVYPITSIRGVYDDNNNNLYEILEYIYDCLNKLNLYLPGGGNGGGGGGGTPGGGTGGPGGGGYPGGYDDGNENVGIIKRLSDLENSLYLYAKNEDVDKEFKAWAEYKATTKEAIAAMGAECTAYTDKLIAAKLTLGADSEKSWAEIETAIIDEVGTRVSAATESLKSTWEDSFAGLETEFNTLTSKANTAITLYTNADKAIVTLQSNYKTLSDKVAKIELGSNENGSYIDLLADLATVTSNNFKLDKDGNLTITGDLHAKNFKLGEGTKYEVDPDGEQLVFGTNPKIVIKPKDSSIQCFKDNTVTWSLQENMLIFEGVDNGIWTTRVTKNGFVCFSTNPIADATLLANQNSSYLYVSHSAYSFRVEATSLSRKLIVNMKGLPTSTTGLSTGDVYNDGGVLKIK